MTRPVARVVLADDSADLRDVMRSYLERGGVDVVAEAADGAGAVQLAEQFGPDVVVLDVTMPGIPVGETIIRLQRVASAPRIVVYSGWPAGELAGMGVTVVAKSADPSELLAGVLAAASAAGGS